MSDEMTTDDYREAISDWAVEYGITEEIEYSEENYEKVKALDPRLVWTYHSTCENDAVSNGCSVFNSCCWSTFSWYIGTVPWGTNSGKPEDWFEQYAMSFGYPCPVCNEDGEEENVDPDCERCEGDGYVQDYYDDEVFKE